MDNTVQIDLKTARRFLLSYQGLLSPRSIEGKKGMLAHFDRIRCIQFDPLDVVGRNPDLVLQSRVRHYSESLLYDLLYNERRLIDGWDKLMCIYKTEDWPFFRRRRDDFKRADTAYASRLESVVPKIRQEVAKRGPVSTSDIEHNDKVDWHWGPTREAKAVLELMWNRGELIIQRKERVRRIYDLANRHMPASILNTPEPIPDDDRYRDWYVERRIGSVGMLSKLAGDEWHGVWGTKTPARRASIDRLVAAGTLAEIEIDGIAAPYYLKTSYLPMLDAVSQSGLPERRAVILAPLDNLMWGRKNILERIFGFAYRWEVYKPAHERRYGYYVLPVLYGDRFIARFEPTRRGEGNLGIVNWWWEDNVRPDADMKEALIECFDNFLGFVQAERLERRDGTTGDRSLAWVPKVRRGY